MSDQDKDEHQETEVEAATEDDINLKPESEINTAATEDVKTEDNDDSQPEADQKYVDQAVIEKLSYGLLERCLPSLQKSKSVLNDVLQNQGILIDSVQQENSKFDECKAMTELSETMEQAKKYHNKLVWLKKEMNNLTDKSFKLKKRALKLQQQKQKEELQRVQQQDRDQERERALEARVAKRTSDSNSAAS